MDNDGQQQDSEYRAWLADEEAQREYQAYLDMMANMSKTIDAFFTKLEGKENEQL